MDLDELRAFIAVADNGSFKSAATNSGQPRGTLRRRVSALESRAGVALLNRDRNGVTLTEAGVELVRHGRQTLREAASLMRMLRAVHRQARSVRVGLPLGFPPEGLQMFCSFMDRVLPQMRIEFQLSADPVDQLMDELDVAWSFNPRAPNKQVVTRALVEFRSGLVASEDYLARHGTPTSINELEDHRLLTWVHNEIGRSSWPLLQGGSVEIEPVLASQDFQMIRRAAARDGGIALLPDVNLPRLDPEDHKLVRVLSKEVGHRHRLYVHLHPNLVTRDAEFENLAAMSHRFMSSMVPPAALLTDSPITVSNERRAAC